MARKLRLEFPGACYHVINRGNYRADIFRTEGTRNAFESCLFEGCAKSDWLLHAYVLMSNHYHLALETPRGNLVIGMQWLQATFANRFNRFRGERGDHVVGFHALDREHRPAERLDCFLERLDLRGERLGHRRAVGLVLGVLGLAEGGAARVEHAGARLSLVILGQPP